MTSTRSLNPWFVLAAFLCALPVLIPVYPPLADLPQHVASVMVLDLVHFGDYRFAELFDFNWFRPYWFGYSLIWVLSYVVGLVWAAKLVVAASVIGFVLALAWLRREVNAPPMIDWLFLAAPFGFAYEWGFLNFIVCAPLGPLFLVSYHRFLLGRVAWWWICAWVLVLFFGHLLIVAFFCMAASVMALRQPAGLRSIVLRILPMTICIPMGIAWLMLNVEPRNVSNPIVWGLGIERLVKFFPDFFALDYNAASIVIALALLGMPFLLGVRPKWSISTIAPVVFFVLFMMLTPSLLLDNLGTVERFHIFSLMFYTLMLADADVRPPEFLPRIGWLVVALPGIVGLALLARVAIKSYGFEKESAEFQHLLTLTQPGQRALSLVDTRNSEFARAPVYMHFPVWYQVEQRGLVDFNFAQWTSLNSFYKPASRSRIDSRFAWYPHEFNWQKHDGDAYDYFILHGSPEFAGFVFRDDAARVNLLYAGRSWFLFGRAKVEVQADAVENP